MTHKIVIDGATLCFEPDEGWDWFMWQGEVELELIPGRTMLIEGKKVCLESDIPRLSEKLSGHAYTATGFENIPGSVTAAVVKVDKDTLSELLNVNGEKVVTIATTGSFTIKCSPAKQIVGTTTIDDVMLTKTGKWRIQASAAEQVKAR